MAKLQSFLDAYAANDADALAGALAEDAVWHVGGRHRFSGEYRGRDAVLGYFAQVGEETASTLRLEPLEVMAHDARGAAFLRVTASRGGQDLDVTMAEAVQFDDQGRIREFWAHATDQASVDAFWS